MFDELYKKLVSVKESVSQLAREVPGISVEDQKLIFKAVEDGILSDAFPSYNEMMSALTDLPDVEEADWDKLDPSRRFADTADVKGIYLQRVILPQLKGEVEGEEITHKLSELDEIDMEAINDLLFEITTSLYRHEWEEDFLSRNEGTKTADRVSRAINRGMLSNDPGLLLLLKTEEDEKSHAVRALIGISSYERKMLIFHWFIRNMDEIRGAL